MPGTSNRHPLPVSETTIHDKGLLFQPEVGIPDRARPCLELGEGEGEGEGDIVR